MHNIFKSDFRDFLSALNRTNAEYLVVGGYAVIIHGYFRTTQDLDIWVNNTSDNYEKLKKSFSIFGMPMFDMTQEKFLSDDCDVFSFGRSPLRIDLITKLKGLTFSDAFSKAIRQEIDDIEIKYLNLQDLITAKTASGRYRDLDDIEKLEMGNSSSKRGL